VVWKSWHLVPNDVEDVFLVRVIKPFLRDVVWAEPTARAFFVRYHDETGPHIRLRIKGRENWFETKAIPELILYLERKCKFSEAIYTPEPDRFGGEDALLYAEEHAHLSTKVVLKRISRVPYVYGDAMFDTLRLQIMTAHAAGMGIEDTKQYMRRLRDSWAPAFIHDVDGNKLTPEGFSDLVETFQEQLEPQREKLTKSLADVWYYLKQGLFDEKQAEWQAWHQGNRLVFKNLGAHTETALPQLMHLHNNRMGIPNYDEVYICHILSEVL
jgi:thiopeptide-type bacteriocin biosynthesis protein